ncbi:hypothetical protein [Mesorhizobium xinjiangense]|uniref:hypothetical protein n=1 Tax=Mesorhizobium xinjiangense TaxID=2678685 RepID=UPI0012EE1EA7|nr:hypothetical protein [Mesorhizobium xinjiangense]
MATPLKAKWHVGRTEWAPGMARWLGLAAAPTFGLMAWIVAVDAPRGAICSAMPDMLPIGGMAWMYLLMSLFHLPPWLKLASGRPRRLAHTATQTEGD